MTAYIIDTETTGLMPPVEPTEIAYKLVTWKCISDGLEALKEGHSPFDILEAVFSSGGNSDFDTTVFVGRFKPSKPIEKKAAELTGITDFHVKDCPPSSSFILPKMAYFIAHNAVFDYGVLGKPDVKRVCTKEIAQNIFTKYKKDGLKNNKLSSLTEFFYPNEAETLLKTSHGALQDIKLVYLLLLKIADTLPKADSFDYLLRYCSQGTSSSNKQEQGVISQNRFKEVDGHYRIMFGKHKEVELRFVPTPYLRWLTEATTNAAEKELLLKHISGGI
jgi:exodeoxyribonuclease X